MTSSVLHQCRLENGLELVFHDLSNRYYGDFYQVKIDVVSSFKLTEKWLSASGLSGREQVRAKNRYGDLFVSHRELKRMGVAGAEVAKVTADLIRQFLDSSLSYMSGLEYPVRLLRQRLTENAHLRLIDG